MRSEVHPPAIVRSAADLRILAGEIKAAHRAGEDSTMNGLEQFKDAGLRLLRVKEAVGHGAFESWVEKNVGFSIRTAQRYMRLAREWSKATAVSLLEDALRLVEQDAESDNDRPSQPSQTPPSASRNGSPPPSTEGEDPPPAAQTRPAEPPRREPGDDTAMEEESEKDGPLVDAEGKPVPPRAALAFERAREMLDIGRDIDALVRRVKDVTERPGGRLVQFEDVRLHFKNAKGGIVHNRPTHVCPLCKGDDANCRCCKGEGWTAEHVWKRLTEEVRRAKP